MHFATHRGLQESQRLQQAIEAIFGLQVLGCSTRTLFLSVAELPPSGRLDTPFLSASSSMAHPELKASHETIVKFALKHKPVCISKHVIFVASIESKQTLKQFKTSTGKPAIKKHVQLS